eukprot:Amastigsp_a841016_930.p3 type:complete len:158 gc:universal Amastigsp_a841016_930:495-22(-)
MRSLVPLPLLQGTLPPPHHARQRHYSLQVLQRSLQLHHQALRLVRQGQRVVLPLARGVLLLVVRHLHKPLHDRAAVQRPRLGVRLVHPDLPLLLPDLPLHSRVHGLPLPGARHGHRLRVRRNVRVPQLATRSRDRVPTRNQDRRARLRVAHAALRDL